VDVFDGIVEIPDLNLALVERVWPVVIVPSTIVQSEVLWDHIRERSPGLFQSHSALQPPTLFSFEDYEVAMGAVEAGKGLPMLLAERAGGLYATMPPSHFFAARVRDIDRPRYLNEQLRGTTDEMVTRMFRQPR
jgi:hypothetical protein